MSCEVCKHPANTDINGTHLCQHHYDGLRERLRWRSNGAVSYILEQMKIEWSFLLKAGVVEGPEDQRLRAAGAATLPGME